MYFFKYYICIFRMKSDLVEELKKLMDSLFFEFEGDDI